VRNPRIVVDTNVWISALLSKTGAPAYIMGLFAAGKVDVVVSRQLLDELNQALSHNKIEQKYGITPDIRRAFIRQIEMGADVVELEGQSYGCRDEDDDIVIETALRGNADVLVSGDSDLVRDAFTHKLLNDLGIEIMKPRSFLEAVAGSP
jgi:putative PIN family toxin of toxin-antitoxin system